MKKWLFIVLGVGLAGGAYYWYALSHSASPDFQWRTAKIERGDITTLVTATGSLSAVTTVQVGTQVTGTISRLLVDFNSVVRKGQIIAILDTSFLVASRDDALANTEKARAQYNQYQREYNRVKKLFDEKVNAQADYDLALTNLELGRTNLRSAEAQLNRARINLQYATIRAPISGTVISRNVDVGQTVISSFNTPTLFTIANDLTHMQVQANIDEADIGQIQVGQYVSFTVDAYPNEVFKGTVQQIRLQPVTIQNVVNYVVIIDVPNPDLKLMPGLTANISVKVQEHKDVLKVPISALRFTPPEGYGVNTDSIKKNGEVNRIRTTETIGSNPQEGVLWLSDGQEIYPEKVQTGINDGTYIEVIGNGLKSNDVIVTGINHSTETSTSTSNPFMPKMPTRRGR
ncbi:MAG: efflux RND transporter periplasmic adaptor subunit [Bacteroidetes bacterium]|nr:efflux RND transporter periplasmic adaptor subunit [Bacteroidota bacterium]